MAEKISQVRQAYEARGKQWTPEVYRLAVEQYGAEVDEPPPGKPVSGFGAAMAGAKNFAGETIRGLTGGLSPSSFLPREEYETGSGFGDWMTNKLYPGLGGALGMGVAMAVLPTKGPILRPGAQLLAKLVHRAVPAAERFGIYEAVRGGGEGAREDGVGGAVKGAVHGGFKGAGIGAMFGALPTLPMKYGAEAAKSGAAMAALTVAEGGSPEDALAAFVIGGGLAGMGHAALPQGKTEAGLKALAEQRAKEVSDQIGLRPMTSDWQMEGAPLGEQMVRSGGLPIDYSHNAVLPEATLPPTVTLTSPGLRVPSTPPGAQFPAIPNSQIEPYAGRSLPSELAPGPIDILPRLPQNAPSRPLGFVAPPGGHDVAPGPVPVGVRPQPPATGVGDIYLGSGPLHEVIRQLKEGLTWREPKQPYKYGIAVPLYDIPADVALRSYINTNELSEMAQVIKNTRPLVSEGKEIPLPEQPKAVQEYVKILAKTVGDTKRGWSFPPTEEFEGITGGKPGNVVEMALTGPFIGAERGRVQYTGQHETQHAQAAKMLGVTKGSKAAKATGLVGEYIKTPEDVAATPVEVLGRPEVAKIVAEAGLTPEEAVASVGLAQVSRKFFDQMRLDDNMIREAHGREPIPYIEGYVTHMRSANLSEMLGLREQPGATQTGYIHPGEVKNPRAEHRAIAAEYERNTDILDLLDGYARITGKDIFYNTALPHMRSVAKLLNDNGMPNSAAMVHRIIDEKFGLVKQPKEWHVSGKFGLGARNLYRGLANNAASNALAFNLRFTLGTQIPGSAGFILSMTNARSTAKGLAMQLDPAWWRAMYQNADIPAIKQFHQGRLAHTEPLAGGKIGKLPLHRVIGNAIIDAGETFTTSWGAAAHYTFGKDVLGLEGRALWQFASQGAQKTTGFYNRFNKASLFSSRDVNSADLFQGFQNQAMADVAADIAPGLRVGWYNKNIDPGTPAGKVALTRAYRLGKWIVWMAAINQATEKAGLGTSFRIPGTFIPFGNIAEGVVGAPDPVGAAQALAQEDTEKAKRLLFRSKRWGRGDFFPIQAGKEGATAFGKLGEAGFDAAVDGDLEGVMREYMDSGDLDKLRKFAFTYVWPKGGGGQINKMWDAAKAFIEGGSVIENGVETIYLPKEQWPAAALFGVHSTKAAQEARDETE